MKKHILHIILYLFAIIVVDQAFGLFCRYLNAHAKKGDTAKHYYIAKECNEDILIFGSSRAEVTYDPQILEDSLGMSVYNCGTMSSGIFFQYGRLLMITERYCPKLIIYDVTTYFDIVENDDLKSVSFLKRFYDSPGVDEIFSDISKLENLKMLSQFYRYNGYFLDMVTDNFGTDSIKDNKGYKPMFMTIDYEPDPGDRLTEVLEWDPIKKMYFQKFVDRCKEKEIPLIIAYSPIYRSESDIAYTEVTKFCTENDVPLINYYANPSFVNSREWFADTLHMNAKGGKRYTTEIITFIRNVLNRI